MDYNRFKKTFAWVAANDYKSIIRTAIGLTLGLTFLYSVDIGLDKTYLGETWLHAEMVDMWIMTLCIYLLIMTVTVGDIARDMRNNDGRVMALMLPASNGEKFLARMLWMTLSMTAAYITAAVCADLLRVTLSYAFGWNVHTLMFWDIISEGNMFNMGGSPISFDRQTMTLTLMFVLSAICSHSFFTLGGTFFRRRPILLTMATSFVLSSLFGLVTSTAMIAFPDFFTALGQWFFAPIEEGGVWPLYIPMAIISAFTAFNYWAAYKLYCRIPVISNKWINL